ETEVAFHVLRIDRQAVHQPHEQAEHVIKQRAGVGKDDALDAAVADVALVPEGDVFEGGHGVAAEHAGKASEALPGDGIALVRHGAAAFLAFGEGFFGFEDFGALQVAEFNRPAFDARADERQRGHELGVDVALDDLRGDGCGTQAEFPAHGQLDPWRKVRAGADRAAEFADGDDFANHHQSAQGARKLIMHQREFEAKGRRFSVDAVAAANAGRELVFARLFGNGSAQALHVRNEEVRRLHHLNSERGVNDIAAGQAKVEPATGLILDFFSDGFGEGNHVVVQGFFQLLLAGNQTGQISKPLFRTALYFGEIGARHDALPDERFAGEQFDLEPEAEPVFVGP